jgi:hypothetical protein
MSPSRSLRARRRSLLAVTLAAVTAALGTVLAAPAQAVTPPERVMWVWDSPDPQAVVDAATARGVTELFLAVPPDVATSGQLPRIEQTIQVGHAAGIRVSALGGDTGWVDDPTWAMTHWVTPTLSVAGFDGLHLDVEPYTSPRWTSSRDAQVKKYLALLTTIVAKAGALPVEADVPFWFGTISSAKRIPLDRAVLHRVDGVSIMAYRNTATGPDGSLAVSAATLRTAGDLGKYARIGQETRFLGTDPTLTKQTFHGQTGTQMQAQFALIDDALTGSRGYRGIAVHDHLGWSALQP